MKVILATSSTPFVYGGALVLVNWLQEALEQRGHEVDVFHIPVHATPDALPVQMLGLRLWDLSGHGDRLITIRTPSHLIRHHSKVAWFIHHHRPAYDFWPHQGDVRDDADGQEFRRMLFAADELGLAECEAVFTNSRTVQERLTRFNGVDSEVLYPALGADAHIAPGPLGDHIACMSRVVPHKRQLLAVEAMAHVQSDVRLVVAGKDAHGSYADEIFATIDRLGLEQRVTFVHGAVSSEFKHRLISGALGVMHAPVDEDSYGYSGLEAASAAKAIVTTTDSGGVLELVEDGRNGLVTEPDPRAVAAAFDRLHQDRALAASLGAGHAGRIAEFEIDWDHIVSRLLA